MLKKFLLSGLLGCSAITVASQQEEPEEIATEIADGIVTKVHKGLSYPQGENREFVNLYITAEIDVLRFIKSSNAGLEVVKKVYVNYEKILKRPKDWVGQPRQQKSMNVGERVRISAKNPGNSSNYFFLIEPDGWDLLEGTSAVRAAEL